MILPLLTIFMVFINPVVFINMTKPHSSIALEKYSVEQCGLVVTVPGEPVDVSSLNPGGTFGLYP